MLAPLQATASTLALPYLGYDTSTFELAGITPRGLLQWQTADLQHSLNRRVDQEKQRQELAVYYYRINHTMAFPLPLAQRPQEMPPGIPGFPAYPWLTWLSWALEERWRILLAANQLQGDSEAGKLLQTELAQLAGWSSFVEWNGQPGLALGHIAGVLALALQQFESWHTDTLDATRQAAMHLLEHDVLPWYEERWAPIARGNSDTLTPAEIHNIPVIALVRSAQLARSLEHLATEKLDACSRTVLQAWCRLRLDAEHPHTEGTAYDGYLMDSLTEWLEWLPDKAAILGATEPALTSLIPHWLHTTLPGRVDIHAPISDVEPEMPFWMSVLVRLARWYDHADARWLAQHLPPDRMPAATLTQLLEHTERFSADTASNSANGVEGQTPNPPQPIHQPDSEPQRLPNAITLRTGWDREDTLVAIGASRSAMSHLHDDSGHVVIGWQNRFWLTDPGYQQYRQGEERDFSIGEAAHNAPIFGDIRQTRRAAEVRTLTRDAARHYTCLDLTACYPDLSSATQVLRHVWLVHHAAATQPPSPSKTFSQVVICDEIHGLSTGAEISTAWQFGTHLAWAFENGWARLSDGQQTLWVASIASADNSGAETTGWTPAQLHRHAGSRGPLTLIDRQTAASPSLKCWKVFQFLPQISWKPPQLAMQTTADNDTVRLRSSDANHTSNHQANNHQTDTSYIEEFSITQTQKNTTS